MRREVLGGFFKEHPNNAWMTADELQSNLRKDQYEAIEPLIREIN